MITRTREEAIRLWVAALRSGEYKQAKERLRSRANNGFCCLGVVCDLAAKDGGPQWSESDEFWGEFDKFLGQDVQLPDVVAEFLSPGFFKQKNPFGRHFFDQLAWDNDCGMSFAEIATVIEKELLP